MARIRANSKEKNHMDVSHRELVSEQGAKC
jgi:hypothetical protein